jgi:hypothetical protein
MSFEKYEEIGVIRKEGQNFGFDPPLRKFSMKSWLARYGSRPILKVG